MSFASFAPNSRFGVPMHPFPPGHHFSWATVQAMLEDVLADLKSPLVQQYLLRSDPLLDAQALSDPSSYASRTSTVFTVNPIKELSGGYDYKLEFIRLHVPTGGFENYTSGIGVDYRSGGGKAVFPRRDRCMKLVFNKLTQSQLKLSRDNEAPGGARSGNTAWNKTVEVAIVKRTRGFVLFCQLVFSQEIFLTAFSDDENGDDSVDFAVVNASLLQSVIGGIQMYNPDDVSSSNNVGHLFKNVISSYANSNIMMAFPVFTEGQWEQYRDPAVHRRMQGWGITDRLRRVPFGPMRTLQLENMSRNGTNLSSEEGSLITNSTRRSVSIAPQSVFNTPHPSSTILTGNPRTTATRIAPLPHFEKELTEDEKKEAERIRKAEKRKIEKRVAAQRSNERKTAERRRKRMLQIKKK